MLLILCYRILYYVSYVVTVLTFFTKTGNLCEPTPAKNKISQQFYVGNATNIHYCVFVLQRVHIKI